MIQEINNSKKNEIHILKSKINDLVDEAIEIGAAIEFDAAQNVIDTLYSLQNNITEYSFLDIDDFCKFQGIEIPEEYSSIVEYLLRNYALKTLKSMLDTYFKIKKTLKEDKVELTEVPDTEFDHPTKNKRIYLSPLSDSVITPCPKEGVVTFDINTQRYKQLQTNDKFYQLDIIPNIKQGDILTMHTEFEALDIIIVDTKYLGSNVVALYKKKNFVYIFNGNVNFSVFDNQL